VIEDVRMSSSLASRPLPLQDVGVSIHRDRRRFTAAFKLKIIEEAARCVEPGALGALLRREGLYSSHLAAWRAAAKSGALSGPARRRGPKPVPPDPHVHRILVLERALAKATARAEHAEALVELQKKVAELLGRTLPTADGPNGTR
jgi:transposase